MSKVAKPLVSIGLPVFLGEKFLRESLPKICRQSYENIEIIVIDDNSSDKSLEICKMMYKRFKNFKLLSNKKNLGAIDNFKKTLFLSKGDFFCWACQDDFFDKKFIEKQVDIFTKNKNIVATLPSWDLLILKTTLYRLSLTRILNYLKIKVNLRMLLISLDPEKLMAPEKKITCLSTV